MTYLAACFSTPALFLAVALTLRDGAARKALGPVALSCFLLWIFHHSPPSAAERLLCCSLWLLYVIKGWSVLKIPRSELQSYSPAGLLLFSYIWPGVDPRPFRRRGPGDPDAARWFVFGFPTACAGLAAALLLAVNSENVSSSVLGLGGVAAVLTIVHLGYSDVLSSLVRLLGFPVTRLFNHPLASTSLRDFWSNRWNRPFVEMNRLLFHPLLAKLIGRRRTVLGLFLLSGLLHELALSFPPGRGWGGPLVYFLIQGTCMLLERRFRLDRHRLRRLWTWTVILLPLPFLFHTAFRESLVLPLWHSLHSLEPLSGGEEFLRFALSAVAWGHFLILVASFQVPYRLNWREELQRLRPLNRKLLWTYGGYIAGMIFLWGVLTLNLLPELMGGDRAALALAGVIALFWWSRVGIDAFIFEHSDWPPGVEFVLGHTMLTSLFVTIAGTYTALLCWHLL